MPLKRLKLAHPHTISEGPWKAVYVHSWVSEFTKPPWDGHSAFWGCMQGVCWLFSTRKSESGRQPRSAHDRYGSGPKTHGFELWIGLTATHGATREASSCIAGESSHQLSLETESKALG